jgi:GntR family transcriptional repressor for pyruvate dehydrogenase complex
MPFLKVQPEKLSSSVVRQIEQLILRGILRPGERLPAERELSDRLGVSRPSLREAIAELRTAACWSAAPAPASLWPRCWVRPFRPR